MATLRPFSMSQRYLFAIQWYRAEVNNGGHDQFFWNNGGIVWEHALDGLGAIGLIARTGVLDEKMLAFAREHAADFRFNGFVEMLDLPERGAPSRLT